MVAWERIILPDNQSVALSAFGGDAIGRTGASGRVNRRFGERFGSAALISLLASTPRLAAQEIDNDTIREGGVRVTGDLVEMNPATTNERMIVHGMQRLRWKEAVVESGECSCELRYPDWAAIISDFNENYALLDRQEMFEIDMAYHDKAAALRAEAAAICHEHGR